MPKKTVKTGKHVCPHCDSSNVKIVKGKEAAGILGSVYAARALDYVNKPFDVCKCQDCQSEAILERK